MGRGERRADERGGDPEADRGGGAVPTGRGVSGERDAEEQEAEERDADAGPLTARECHPGRPFHEQSEQTDSPGGNGLNERERGERQRHDVEPPTAEPGDETGEPAGFEKSSRSERSGLRTVSGGNDDAAPCWVKNPQFSAAAEPRARTSPTATETLIAPIQCRHLCSM